MAIAVKIVSSTEQQDNPSSVPSPEPPEFVADLLRQRVDDNVKGAFTAVLSDEEQPMIERTDEDGANPRYVGVYRFSDAEDKAQILDKIENQVVADAKSYDIQTHACTHDGTGDACPGWSTERTR